MTPITPVLVRARTAEELLDAGYDSCVVWLEVGSPLKPNEWEPISPGGRGWFLHAKDRMEDGGIRAVWARRLDNTAAAEIANIREGLLAYNYRIEALHACPALTNAEVSIEAARRFLNEAVA